MPEGNTLIGYVISLLLGAVGAFASGKIMPTSSHDKQLEKRDADHALQMADKDRQIQRLVDQVNMESDRADRTVQALMRASGIAAEVIEIMKTREREARR
jgi:hypothetical protein